jgi:hypothetical protein
MSNANKHRLAAGALALTVVVANAWAAEPVTYTGSGNYVAKQDLMPLQNGDAVILGTAQGAVAISTAPPMVLDVRCSGMGLSRAGGDYGSVIYCAFADPVNRDDGFDVKGVERGDQTSLEVVGGSGKWVGASGSGSLHKTTNWTNGGAFRFEITIAVP